MTVGGARGAMENCPVCDTAVRSDRIELHAAKVHPGRAREIAALRRRRARPSTKPLRAGNARRAGGRGPGFRWIWIGVGVAVLALVLYAVLHLPSLGQAQVGKVAPDFTFTTLSGATQSLSSYRGQPVVLWWVAAFCSSCSQGTQYFAQSYAGQYHAAGVTLLEIEDYNDLGQPGPSLSAFASQNGYTGQPGWIIGAGSSQGTTAYNPVGYLDVYFVISPSGSITATGQGLSGSFATALQQAQSS